MPTAQQQQALLAQQPPTAPTNALQGVNQAFQATTPEQSAALAGINKQFAPQTGTPPVVDISNPTQQIEIPTTPEPRVDAERVSAGLTPFIEEQKAMEAKAQARIDEGQDISNQLLRQLSPETQTQEFRDLEQERLGPIQGDIKDSLTRLESIRSGYEAQLIREEQAPGGTAIGALSRTNQIKVNQAREELPIIATIQYQQGQLSDARQSIDTMFNIQRDALETQLNYVSSFIAKNEDKLSNAQRNKLDIALAEEQRRVDEGTALIDDQKAAAEYATGLIPRMDKESIAELQKDITRGMGYQEALAKYGQFEGVKTEDEQLSTQLLNEKILSEQASRITTSSGESFNLGLLSSLASEYAATGKIPSGIPEGQFGLISAIAKSTPQQPGRVVDSVTGLPSQNISSGVQNDLLDLKSGIDLLEQMKESFSGENQLIQNPVIGLLGKVFPSEERTKFETLRSEFIDLTLRARTGAVINESEFGTFAKKVPKAGGAPVTKGQDPMVVINALQNTLANRLDTYLNGNGVEIVGYFSPSEMSELEKLEAKLNQ